MSYCNFIYGFNYTHSFNEHVVNKTGHSMPYYVLGNLQVITID